MDYSVKTPKQLGQVLKGLRREKKITQAAAGSRIGLRQSEISGFESDPSKSSLDRLFRFLSTLDLDFYIRDRAAPPAKGKKTRSKRSKSDQW